MDPNLIAQLLANDPNTTTTQPTNPAPQTIPPTLPPQPQTTTALQSTPPAPSSPAPSTNNQLAPPRRNKYTNAFNPYSGPRYYDSDSDYESDDDGNSFLGININSPNDNGNIYGPINNGINFGSMSSGWPGWPNGSIVINGYDWSGIPQSQWPASVRRDYRRGMEAGARGMEAGARAMEQAAELMSNLGLGGMGLGMGMGGRRRRRR
jgi:hypothetical protein